MIRVRFFEQNGVLTGFEIEGHSFFSESGTDIVCSAVSSAAIMAANTVTEVFGEAVDVQLGEGYLSLKGCDLPSTQGVMQGLKLHLEQLAEQYPAHITVS